MLLKMCVEKDLFRNLVFGNSAALEDSQVKDFMWYEALPVKRIDHIIFL